MANMNLSINVTEAANGFVVDVYRSDYDNEGYAVQQNAFGAPRSRKHIAKTMDEVKDIVGNLLNAE